MLSKRSDVDLILPTLDDTNWNKENIFSKRQTSHIALVLLPVNVRFFF